MESRVCQPEELADIIVSEFKQYSDDVAQECKAAVKDVAKKCRAEVKAKSPINTGGYAQGWTTKTTGDTPTSIHITVYNRKKPGLAHLLEHGHKLVGGGEISGKPHIGPAEAKANDELVRRIKEICKQ